VETWENYKKLNGKVEELYFRLSQLELALMNLMFVVANQEKELPKFKKNIAKAEEMANTSDALGSLLINDDKAEA
jgi:ribosomal protein L29